MRSTLLAEMRLPSVAIDAPRELLREESSRVAEMKVVPTESYYQKQTLVGRENPAEPGAFPYGDGKFPPRGD